MQKRKINEKYEFKGLKSFITSYIDNKSKFISNEIHQAGYNIQSFITYIPIDYILYLY